MAPAPSMCCRCIVKGGLRDNAQHICETGDFVIRCTYCASQRKKSTSYNPISFRTGRLNISAIEIDHFAYIILFGNMVLIIIARSFVDCVL